MLTAVIIMGPDKIKIKTISILAPTITSSLLATTFNHFTWSTEIFGSWKLEISSNYHRKFRVPHNFNANFYHFIYFHNIL
jgi:hypothetical protein